MCYCNCYAAIVPACLLAYPLWWRQYYLDVTDPPPFPPEKSFAGDFLPSLSVSFCRRQDIPLPPLSKGGQNFYPVPFLSFSDNGVILLYCPSTRDNRAPTWTHSYSSFPTSAHSEGGGRNPRRCPTTIALRGRGEREAGRRQHRTEMASKKEEGGIQGVILSIP